MSKDSAVCEVQRSCGCDTLFKRHNIIMTLHKIVDDSYIVAHAVILIDMGMRHTVVKLLAKGVVASGIYTATDRQLERRANVDMNLVVNKDGTIKLFAICRTMTTASRIQQAVLVVDSTFCHIGIIVLQFCTNDKVHASTNGVNQH